MYSKIHFRRTTAVSRHVQIPLAGPTESPTRVSDKSADFVWSGRVRVRVVEFGTNAASKLTLYTTHTSITPTFDKVDATCIGEKKVGTALCKKVEMFYKILQSSSQWQRGVHNVGRLA